jgi:hypothetical protein
MSKENENPTVRDPVEPVVRCGIEGAKKALIQQSNDIIFKKSFGDYDYSDKEINAMCRIVKLISNYKHKST